MRELAGQVVARANDELRALWATPPQSSEPIKSRACTMNLVVVAATPALAADWVHVVDEIVQRLPARAIVVGLDPDGDEQLDAKVSAVCTRNGTSGGEVCSERITLVARGSVCMRLPSCVEALCATDVPTTLVWLARVHADDPTFTPLAREANRIVLDATSSSLGSLAHVLRWARAQPEVDRPGIADLCWTRLATWQELCAQMFDRPEVAPLATNITQVTIAQASSGNAWVGPESALILGWLATRLGWRPVSLAGRLRLLRPDGVYLPARLRAQSAPDRARGSLLALGLEAQAEGISMHAEIARDPEIEGDRATWRVDVTRDGQVYHLGQRLRLRQSEPAQLLERTLHRPRQDEALAEAALWADELRGEEMACG